MQKPDFESMKQMNVLGHEYWSARDLMPLLGYGDKWQNVEKVIAKAMIAGQVMRQRLNAGHLSNVERGEYAQRSGANRTGAGGV